MKLRRSQYNLEKGIEIYIQLFTDDCYKKAC